MKNSRHMTWAPLLGLLMLPSIALADLDCVALSNSALVEPEGYAAQCLNVTPSPTGGVIDAPTDTGYKYDMRDNPGVYTHPLNNFPGQTFVGNPSATDSFFAWDFDPTGTTLYAHDFDTNMFGTVDTGTGAFTPIAAVTGFGAQTFSGLTIDPVSGSAYASGTDGVTSTLYSFDLGSAVATSIGNIGALELVIDIAMNCNGELYAHDLTTDSLYSVDPGTAAPTLIGGHGLAANFAQGMDFDNDTDTLYGYIYTGGGTNTYGTWDTNTGAVTPISVDNPIGEWEGAIPTTCPVAGPVIPIIEVPTLRSVGLLALLALLAVTAVATLRFRQ